MEKKPEKTWNRSKKTGVLNSVYLQKVEDRCPRNGVYRRSRDLQVWSLDNRTDRHTGLQWKHALVTGPRDHGSQDWFVFKPQSTSLWKILAGWLTTEQTASDWASNYVFSAWHGGTAQGLLEWTCQVPQNLEKILQQVISQPWPRFVGQSLVPFIWSLQKLKTPHPSASRIHPHTFRANWEWSKLSQCPMRPHGKSMKSRQLAGHGNPSQLHSSPDLVTNRGCDRNDTFFCVCLGLMDFYINFGIVMRVFSCIDSWWHDVVFVLPSMILSITFSCQKLQTPQGVDCCTTGVTSTSGALDFISPRSSYPVRIIYDYYDYIIIIIQELYI